MRFVVLACLSVLSANVVHGLDVTTCGQVVPAGVVADLTADLDCGAFAGPGAALQLGAKVTLRLHGFELVGAAGAPVVQIPEQGPVMVEGPGQIRNGSACITSQRGRLLVRDVVVTGCETGIDLPLGRVVADDTGIIGNGDGVVARIIEAIGVTANDNDGRGLVATSKMRLTLASASGNGAVGVVGKHVRADQVDLNHNGLQGAWVLDGRFRGALVYATGNGSVGILGGDVTLKGGSITGNGTGPVGGADLRTARRPRLLDVACGTSEVTNTPGLSWGVCAND